MLNTATFLLFFITVMFYKTARTVHVNLSYIYRDSPLYRLLLTLNKIMFIFPRSFSFATLRVRLYSADYIEVSVTRVYILTSVIAQLTLMALFNTWGGIIILNRMEQNLAAPSLAESSRSSSSEAFSLNLKV